MENMDSRDDNTTTALAMSEGASALSNEVNELNDPVRP